MIRVKNNNNVKVVAASASVVAVNFAILIFI